MPVFLVLEQIDLLERVGQTATAYKVAAALDMSVYKARKLLNELHHGGLVFALPVMHRPNIAKTIYTLTAKGLRVLRAYEGV